MSLRLSLILFVLAPLSIGSNIPADEVYSKTYTESLDQLSTRLEKVRKNASRVEKELIRALKRKKDAKARLAQTKRLIRLHRQEEKISRKRYDELDRFVKELELRKQTIQKKIVVQRGSIRRSLVEIEKSIRKPPAHLGFVPDIKEERLEAPKRKVFANLVERNIRDIEALKVDIADAIRLEKRIEDERQQLAYLFQDLKQQQSLLEFHEKLQEDVLRKRHEYRLGQLKRFRKLKQSEAKIESLIRRFSTRLEFERLEEQERQASKAMILGSFRLQKGKLPLPVDGKIVSRFGRQFDTDLKLEVFKKGLEISTRQGEDVRNIFPGRVAYAGKLPRYGNVMIIDHGAHYYSLIGRLGEIKGKVGNFVRQGETLALADEKATPIYFEIRSRNIAVNPLQWISN